MRQCHVVFAPRLFVLLLLLTSAAAADWPQWGGSDRNFNAPEVELADSWPEDGPPRLWSRVLGDGYSSVAVVGGRLYTMYRERDDEEIVAAFAASDGETLWQHRYTAPSKFLRLLYGKGPHATPLVTGGRVFVTGITGRLSALDSDTGELLWSHDLWQDFGGNQLVRGYAASAIAYRDTVILPVGEAGRGMVAFAQDDGRVVWQAQNFKASQASPILIEVDGREQLVGFVVDEIVGLDPSNGKLLWSHRHTSAGPYNISTPVWTESDSSVFASSAYGGGSRALRLSMAGGKATAEELWQTSKLRVQFTNALRIDDHFYGSSGVSGTKILVALDARTGEVTWKDRAIVRAHFVRAGDKVVVLEADGRLMLVSLTPEGLTVHAEAQIAAGKTWTPPSLVGRTLFVRDTERLMAFELPGPDDASQPRAASTR